MSSQPHDDPAMGEDEQDVVEMDEVAEEIQDNEEDVYMSDPEDDDQEEINLVNDSVAYFDNHKDSVFAIAQHPKNPRIVATGGSEGSTEDAPGKGYIFVVPEEVGQNNGGPVLPPSYATDPSAAAQEMAARRENPQIQPAFAIDGHTDSINALAFTLPNGEFLASGGMDGRLRVYKVDAAKPSFSFVAESQEVSEVIWLAPCPNKDFPSTIALGASDGSVWVYTIDPSDPANPLQIIQTYFLHTDVCNAGAWTPDGTLLATVDQESSLYVWDVFGLAAAQGLVGDNGQTVVSLTGQDQRFEVEGGLYSVAVEPRGRFLAVGGFGGVIRIVGLPRILDQTAGAAPASGSKAGKAKGKAVGGRAAGGVGEAQAGQILNTIIMMDTQNKDGGSIETLSFSRESAVSSSLLAAGSTDGSFGIYVPNQDFAKRRFNRLAHGGFSVVKVEWSEQPQAAGPAASAPLLTTCGYDGAVKRWTPQGTTASQHVRDDAAEGLVNVWRGHRGNGEGGGVTGFVQGPDGKTIVTAGDDSIVLVFQA